MSNKPQKYLPGTIEKSRLLTKLTNDTLNWSKPKYSFRVRFDIQYLTRSVAFNVVNPDFFQIMDSNTKARRFHGYLEGDYELATAGFYTNNAKGIARLVDRYPEMIDTIQTYDQYKSAKFIASYFYLEGLENESGA